jgi:arginyl-tRNA synthetase
MPFDPIQLLNDRFAAAIAAAFPDTGAIDPLIKSTQNPKFGDFQCNAAMSLAKAVGKPPREVAQAIISAVKLSDIALPFTPASIAGPGFINIALRPDALAALLSTFDTPALGIDPPDPAAPPHTVVVDLCGVNLAKQMHVGHLRAVVIGDALARTFERTGNRVIRQNHVGDWGLPIAMVTARLLNLQRAGKDISALNLDAIEKLYKDAQREAAADDRGLVAANKYGLGPKALAELEEQVRGANESLARAKSTLVALQSHDPETFAVWKRIADVTMAECLAVCARLGANVSAEHSAGESSYAEELAPMVDELVRRGIAEESEGALIIRNEGIEEPTIIRKSPKGGGGFLYATTDMAAIRRRVQKLGADRVIYCVDARQGLHFKQVFASATRAGFATKPGANHPSRLEHAAFGMVLGPDNKPFKTRSGENVKLSDLLDEAITRAAAAVREKNPDLVGEEATTVATAVAMAAIKYTDLSNDRAKDYVFSFDRMLAFEGNTGPYLLYALVRIRSIFRKAIERFGAPAIAAASSAAFNLNTPEERQLALALLRYPNAIRGVTEALEPHRLCQFLFDLAQTFSTFVTNCQVLTAETEALRDSRLRLCALTDRVMADGLNILGIKAVERM